MKKRSLSGRRGLNTLPYLRLCSLIFEVRLGYDWLENEILLVLSYEIIVIPYRK